MLLSLFYACLTRMRIIDLSTLNKKSFYYTFQSISNEVCLQVSCERNVASLITKIPQYHTSHFISNSQHPCALFKWGDLRKAETRNHVINGTMAKYLKRLRYD